jgi:DNA-binding NarL/FixJ family response regulator
MIEIRENKKEIIKALKSGCVTKEDISQQTKLEPNTVKVNLCDIYREYNLSGKDAKAGLMYILMKEGEQG